MKIGIFAASGKDGGGVYQYTVSIISALYERPTNDNFIIFAFPNNAHDFRAYTGPNWILKIIPNDIRAGAEEIAPHLCGDGLSLNKPGVSSKANAYLRDQGIDLMVYPVPTALSFESGIPYLMAVHDLQHRLQPEFPEVSCGNQWKSREYLFRNAIRHARGILVDSEVGKQDVLTFYGEYICQDQIYPLPFVPSFDFTLKEVSDLQRDHLRTKYRLPDRYLFYPAQFWLHKNHSRMVHAIQLLRFRHGIEAPLVLVGSNKGSPTEGRETVFRNVMLLAEHLGVQDLIHYLGYVPDSDMPGLYSMAAALTMPTFFGPTNIPVIEAWALGCPVLTSDIRGIREQICDAGVLVDPQDSAAIAQGIRRLWEDEYLRKVLSQKGRERLKLHSLDRFQRKLCNIIDNISMNLGTHSETSKKPPFHLDKKTQRIESPIPSYRGAHEAIKHGKQEAALAGLEALVERYPDFGQAYKDFGAFCLKKGDTARALANYEKAVDMASDNPVFQKHIADFYYAEVNWVDDAVEHYARALSSNPEDVHILLILGHISVSKKKFEEAAVFYEKVLQIDPENEDAKHYAELLARRNRVHIHGRGEVFRSTGPQAVSSRPSGNSKKLVQGRELLWFEWVVTDFCNLNCDYCVNKGQYSGKPSGQIQYTPGREVEIARRIVALGRLAGRVFVNLTGGEPTLSEHIVDIISLLSQKPNIYVQLITNLKLIDKLGERLAPYFPLINIVGSIHVSYRTHEDIERIINFINKYRSVLNIQLTQVNNRLSRKDIAKLVHIESETGLKIGLQAYIPPAGEISFTNNATRDANIVSSKGKRCCLGYSAFLLEPNGNLIYGLWCARRLTADFLAIDPADFGAYMYDEMKKCPKRSCDCNYNMFAYDFYLRACRRLGYPTEEIFASNNGQGETSLRQGATGC